MIAGNDTRPEQPDLLRAAFTAISKDIDAVFDTL